MTKGNAGYQLLKHERQFKLTKVELSQAALQPREIRIEISAASLNYRDMLVLKNQGGDTREALVPLSDGAGTVVEVGSAVMKWQVGDLVAPSFFSHWNSGAFKKEYLSSALGGANMDGVLRKYYVTSENAVARIPDNLTLQEAATLPCAAVTAWQALVERGNIQPGETILIQGTGGVAIFALQIACALGAKPIVISSSEDKLEKARALGAWNTFNYREFPAWDETLLKLTDSRGVDHVLELGGPDTFQKSINAVAAGGKIYQIGVLTGFAPTPNLLSLQFMNATIHGICVGSTVHLEALTKFIEAHRIIPIIDRQFFFDSVAEAYEYMEKGRHFGKIVLNL